MVHKNFILKYPAGKYLLKVCNKDTITKSLEVLIPVLFYLNRCLPRKTCIMKVTCLQYGSSKMWDFVKQSIKIADYSKNKIGMTFILFNFVKVYRKLINSNRLTA